jgi:hypothetical protein
MRKGVLSPARVKKDLERIHRELEQSLSSQLATRSVSIHMGRDGLVISLREAGFSRRDRQIQMRIPCRRRARSPPRSADHRSTFASRATPTTYPFKPLSLTLTGSLPRHAPPAWHGILWTSRPRRQIALQRLAMQSFIQLPRTIPPKAGPRISVSTWSSSPAPRLTFPRFRRPAPVAPG